MPSLHKAPTNRILIGFILSFGLFVPLGGQAQTACSDNPTNACLNINQLTKDARVDLCSQKNFAEIIANPLLKKENRNFNAFITKVHQEDVLDAEFLGKELVCEARKSHSCLQDICDFIATECRKQQLTPNQGSGYEQVTANFDAQIERCREIVGELNTLHKVQIQTVLTQNTDRKIRTIQNEADSQGRTQAKEELHHRLADVIRQTNRFASKVTVFVEDPLTNDDLSDYGEKQDKQNEQESLAYQQMIQKRMLAQGESQQQKNNIPTRTFWQRLQTQFLSPRPLAPPDNTPPPPMLASPSNNSGTYTEPPLPSGPGGYSDTSLLPPLGTIPSPSSSYNTTGSFGSSSTPSSSASASSSPTSTGTGTTANAAGAGLGSIMEIPFNAVKKITSSLQIDRLLQNVASIYIGQKLLAGSGPLEQALGSAGINFGLGVLTGSQSLTCAPGSAGCMGGFNTGALTSIGANAAQQYIASEIGADNPLMAALVGQGLNGIFSGASASLQNMSLQNLSLQGIAGGIMSLPGQALSGILGTAGGAVSDTGRLVEAVGNTGRGLLGGITGAFNIDQTLQNNPSLTTSGGLFGPMLQGFRDGATNSTSQSSIQSRNIKEAVQRLQTQEQESLLVQNELDILQNLQAASIFDSFDNPSTTDTANVGSGNLIQTFENQMYNPTTTIPDGFFSDTNLDTSQALRAIPVSASNAAATNTAQQFINNGSGPVDSSFLSGLRLDGIANALNGSFLTNVGGAYLAQKLGDGDPIKTVIAQALIQNVMGSVLDSLGGITGAPKATPVAGVPSNPFGDKPGVMFTELKSLSGACENPQTGETVSSCRRTPQKEGYFFINGKPFKVVSGGVYQPHMPSGEYKFSPINGGEIFQTTTKSSMSVDSDGDGTRYGFRIGIAGKDKNGNWMENGSVWDPVLGRNRSLIRIHSDGPNWFEQDSWLVKEQGYTVNGVEDANLGNAGCLSPIGDEEIQKRFFEELKKAYQEGHQTFEVRDCSPGGSSLGSGSGELPKDANGNVSQADLYNYTRNQVANSSLNGFVPSDGANYGITTGSADEWANYFTSLAGRESSWNSGTVGDIGRFEGNSNGLFQLSPNDALNHNLQSTPFTMDQLNDPAFNTNAAIAITANLVRQDGVIASGNQGAARYWGPLQRGWNDITDYSSYRTDSNGAINGNTGNPLLDHLSGGGNSPQSAGSDGCQIDPAAAQSSKQDNTAGGSSGGGGNSAYGSYSAEKTSQQSGLSHSQAERKVNSGGITISSSGGCSDPTKSNCTSLEGVNESLLDALIEIRRQCNCDVVITGGTETGHSSEGMHGTGKAVDLSMKNGTSLSNWVEQNKSGECTLNSIDSACYVIRTSQGNLNFHAETKVSNPHWHVEMPNASSGGGIPRAIPVSQSDSRMVSFLKAPLRALKNFLFPTAYAASASQELQQEKGIFDQVHTDNMKILKDSAATELDKNLALRRINDASNSVRNAYNNLDFNSVSSADDAIMSDMAQKLQETTNLQNDGKWIAEAPTGLAAFFKPIADAIQGIFQAFGNLFGAMGPNGGSALDRAENIAGSVKTLGGNVPGFGEGIRCVGAACEQGLNNVRNTGRLGVKSVIDAGVRSTTAGGIIMGTLDVVR